MDYQLKKEHALMASLCCFAGNIVARLLVLQEPWPDALAAELSARTPCLECGWSPELTALWAAGALVATWALLRANEGSPILMAQTAGELQLLGPCRPAQRANEQRWAEQSPSRTTERGILDGLLAAAERDSLSRLACLVF
ncbi:unnamed protein product [Effrenium voratum]|nr:unnamed protein product [Effrenium voratum]